MPAPHQFYQPVPDYQILSRRRFRGQNHNLVRLIFKIGAGVNISILAKIKGIALSRMLLTAIYKATPLTPI
jgi:hypothetical protein